MGDYEYPGQGTESDLSTKETVDMPKMYRVTMHNDHYTTMEFVVEVLMDVFHRTEPDAVQIMMNIHQQGSGICGVYTLDIAATKTAEVHKRARERGFPLKCSYEEA